MTIYPAVCFYGTNLAVEVISTGILLDTSGGENGELIEDGPLSCAEGLFFSETLSHLRILYPKCKTVGRNIL